MSRATHVQRGRGGALRPGLPGGVGRGSRAAAATGGGSSELGKPREEQLRGGTGLQSLATACSGVPADEADGMEADARPGRGEVRRGRRLRRSWMATTGRARAEPRPAARALARGETTTEEAMAVVTKAMGDGREEQIGRAHV